MNRKAFVNLMNMHNDAYVYYNSKVSNKQKYYVCTLEFSTEYVKKAYIKKFNKVPPAMREIRKSEEQTILVFCWDLNDFKTIDLNTVTSIEGLSDVLRNSRELWGEKRQFGERNYGSAKPG